jgi:hypothetical protein
MRARIEIAACNFLSLFAGCAASNISGLFLPEANRRGFSWELIINLLHTSITESLARDRCHGFYESAQMLYRTVILRG